ncbi:hypothetical protein ACFLZN_00075 [Nanoarchaeota archaeon]
MKKGLSMNKKGAITIWIIIGMIFLFIVVLSVSFYYISQKPPGPGDEKIPSPGIAAELQPIQDHIAACAAIVGEDAVRAIGDGGGYINPSVKTNPMQPTEGDGVQFAPESNLKIPYWFHLASENDCEGNCIFETKRPELRRTPGAVSVEGQLDEYLEENIPDCINFKELEEDYIVTPEGKLQVETIVTRGEVVFKIKYPLVVKKGTVEDRVDKFIARLDVDLMSIFNLAVDVTNHEAEFRFLEQYTRNLIDGFADLDSDAIPPVSGFVVDIGPGVFWIKRDVEQRLQEILHAYIPLLQVYGANNYKFIEAPKFQRDPELYEVLMNRGALIPIEDIPRNLNVKLIFLDWWKPYLDLNCRGQICKGESATSTMGFLFGMQKYNFAYDVSYPVMLEITDPTAFKGRGYSFKFFLEANMRNNQPMWSDFTPLTQLAIPVGSMLCDADKRNSGNISVKIINGKTKRLVDKAYLTFHCGDESCSFNAIYNGSAIINMPLCMGGIVGAEANGFHPTFIPYSTFLDEPGNITMEIEPWRFIDFDIKFAPVRKGGSSWSLDQHNLLVQEGDEETLIQFERIGNEWEEPFITFVTIKGDVFSTAEQHNKDIPLIPGKYKIMLTSMKYADPPIIIPEKNMEINTGPFSSGENVQIPGMEFNESTPLPMMGVEFEFDVKKEDLDTNDKLEIIGIKIALDQVPESDRDIEDVELIGKLDDYYLAYKNVLAPRWKKK